MSRKIQDALQTLGITFNDAIMKEIQESGLNDGPETTRRSYQSYSSSINRRSSNGNNNNHAFRRTIY